MINVLHIGASDMIGGAARAAFRLHRSFRKRQDVDSRMLVRGRASDDEKVIVYCPDFMSLKYQYNFSIKRRAQDIFWKRFSTQNRVMHSRADIWTGLLKAARELPCDLVHLHWLGTNTLSIEEIGQIDKPVVWTLHDMWAFCGAEHYVADQADVRYQTGYLTDNRTGGESGPDMNRSVWLRKKKAWKQPMTLACPSQWMTECARNSNLCNEWPTQCIPNPLELERWKPFPKEQARDLLGLPQDKRILLFGAIGGEKDPRKGADLLREILAELKSSVADVHLVVFGQSEPLSPIPFAYPLTYLGRLQDELSMIAAYNAADILLVPSRQDNLPQTAVEAQACGVPVVAFNVGGLSDIVTHQRTGLLVEPYNTKKFADSIGQLLRDKDKTRAMASAARQAALEKFAGPVVAKAYVELYQKVLSTKR